MKKQSTFEILNYAHLGVRVVNGEPGGVYVCVEKLVNRNPGRSWEANSTRHHPLAMQINADANRKRIDIRQKNV